MIRNRFFILGIFVFLSIESPASHITGGNLFYTCLGETSPGSDTMQYQVILDVYRDCGEATASFEPLVALTIFEEFPGEYQLVGITNLQSNGQLLDQSAQAIDWLWTFPDGTYSTKQNPEFVFPDPGDYPIQLQVWNAFGCRDSVTKSITVTLENRFFLPNAFTPNSDGKNDIFQGTGFFLGIENFQIKILNRWGEMIFQSQNPNFIWDGADAPQGVYLYEWSYQNSQKEIVKDRGEVVLIR